MYFRLMLHTLPVTDDFSLLGESNKLTWRRIGGKVALINDDWRLRNDLPYKAVERYTKPTRIKLQNHLSKLNVTHTKKWFFHSVVSEARVKGTPGDYQSLIFITDSAGARNWWVNLRSRRDEVCLSRFDCFPLPDSTERSFSFLSACSGRL